MAFSFSRFRDHNKNSNNSKNNNNIIIIIIIIIIMEEGMLWNQAVHKQKLQQIGQI
jgi:hypothetical protein